MRSNRHIRSFLKLLEEYPADRPLGKFLPEYYRRNKQMGSNDRRTVSRLMYNFHRMGFALEHVPPEERVIIAEYLCDSSGSAVLSECAPELARGVSEPLEYKVAQVKEHHGFGLANVFPFQAELSAGVDRAAFNLSFLEQPDLYIRVHPGKEEVVTGILNQAGLSYRQIDQHAISLPNGTKLDMIFGDDDAGRPFEVQDISSQSTGRYFKPRRYDHWWDACAASGGKSLLLYSLEPDIRLLVSDVRSSVLDNLDERFINAGLRTYQKKQLDLTESVEPLMHHFEFDGIILDAPCSGSGTWGRTPEMIRQFKVDRLSFFQNLQKNIASNIVRYLKPGKPLIYITCSVFRAENEEVVEWLTNAHDLTVESMETIAGYRSRADTMFVARLLRRG